MPSLTQKLKLKGMIVPTQDISTDMKLLQKKKKILNGNEDHVHYKNKYIIIRKIIMVQKECFFDVISSIIIFFKSLYDQPVPANGSEEGRITF